MRNLKLGMRAAGFRCSVFSVQCSVVRLAIGRREVGLTRRRYVRGGREGESRSRSRGIRADRWLQGLLTSAPTG
jgi:hypothetical protein